MQSDQVGSESGGCVTSECVRDAMRQGVVSCRPDLGLREAVKLMADANVRALVVIDDACGLAGIVSQTDLVNATLLHEQATNWQSLYVRDVMTLDVITVLPDTPLPEAAKLMVENQVHRLVVVAARQSTCFPIGVLSMGDVIRHLAKEKS